MTFPRSVGEVPSYYNHKPSLKRPYVFAKQGPLFPFGWGLSYTPFKFSSPRLSAATIHPEGEVTVSVDVTNTGAREGDEVAEMYIHQRVASITRPVTGSPFSCATSIAFHAISKRARDLNVIPLQKVRELADSCARLDDAGESDTDSENLG